MQLPGVSLITHCPQLHHHTLTRGEIRKQTAKQKPADAPVDLSFVDQFYDRPYLLENNTLIAEQKVALSLNLVKLRSMVYQKITLLK